MKKLLLVAGLRALGVSSTATASQSRYALLERVRGLADVANQTAGCQSISQGCLKVPRFGCRQAAQGVTRRELHRELGPGDDPQRVEVRDGRW